MTMTEEIECPATYAFGAKVIQCQRPQGSRVQHSKHIWVRAGGRDCTITVTWSAALESEATSAI